jgi:DNA-binding response OmpR family regulator
MPALRSVILVIDDDQRTGEMLSALLGDEGYLVERAYDGLTGLARLDEGGVDLVLLDLVLPDVDGAEVVRRVRGGQGSRSVPIIAMSVSEEDLLRLGRLGLGVNDYVMKPFDIHSLRDRVRARLGGGPS